MPQGHDQEENEHNEHDAAPERELPDLAPQVLDLSAPGPDAKAGLIGARGMPCQEPGGDREDNGPHNKADLGDWTGSVYLTAPSRSVSNVRQSGRVGGCDDIGADGHVHGGEAVLFFSIANLDYCGRRASGGGHGGPERPW